MTMTPEHQAYWAALSPEQRAKAKACAAAYKKLIRTGRRLLDQHGLKRWRFEVDALSEDYYGPISDVERENGIERWAQCRYSKKTIYVDVLVAEWPWRKQRDTILHEVAHALAGHKAGHGPRWFRIAERIGVRGKRPDWSRARGGSGCRSGVAS